MTQKASTALSYCAGIIDGEAYIGITRAKTGRHENLYGYRFRSTVNIWMKKREPIQFLCDTFGIKIVIFYRKTTVYPTYIFKVSSLNCERVLNEVFPYLQGKTEQAKTVLEFCYLIKHRYEFLRLLRLQKSNNLKIPIYAHTADYFKKCEELYKKCKELNKVDKPRKQVNDTKK